ncbi:hypothetical protein MPTA5024_17845 [Microbispora sp. ATCC PTA-5024]|nr:hypothetical protein MPTA5024_17845 [Microbispora sp. ATCC PTA-5024]
MPSGVFRCAVEAAATLSRAGGSGEAVLFADAATWAGAGAAAPAEQAVAAARATAANDAPAARFRVFTVFSS